MPVSVRCPVGRPRPEASARDTGFPERWAQPLAGAPGLSGRAAARETNRGDVSAPVVTEEWRATYRLQLEPAFPLAAAAATVPYLASLGVSHLYCSPIFEAVEGSRHGYDVTDPTRVRAALGGAAALAGLVETLRRHRMGLVLDLVPNHMAITGNPWWDDMLTHGARQPARTVFRPRGRRAW